MIHIQPGDLIAIERNGKFYYALILSKIFLFGGQLVYAFHRTTDSLEEKFSAESSGRNGFHYVVDLLEAKKNNRVHRLARNLAIDAYNSFQYFRQDGPTYGLDGGTWAIWDRQAHVVSTPASLSDEQWSYPVLSTRGYASMCSRIDTAWKPEHDKTPS